MSQVRDGVAPVTAQLDGMRWAFGVSAALCVLVLGAGGAAARAAHPAEAPDAIDDLAQVPAARPLLIADAPIRPSRDLGVAARDLQPWRARTPGATLEGGREQPCGSSREECRDERPR